MKAAWLLVAAALALAGCGGGAGGGPSGPTARPPVTVETIVVERRDLAERVFLAGTVLPNESVELRFETAGRIMEILFEEGQRVETGAALVRLDESELQAQLAQARASQQLALSNLRRDEALVASGGRTESDLDRARSEADCAAAEVRLLEVRLARTTLIAPFAGTVGARSISVGDFVNTSTTVTTITDLSRIKVEFSVPEVFATRVRPGSRFTVTARGAAAGSVGGEVYFVSPDAARATRATNVKGYLDGDGGGLRPGAFASVELTLDVRAGVLTVPEGAILVRPDGAVVAAVRTQGEARTVEFVPVRTGLRERGLVEVAPRAGSLNEGDEVVASGVGGIVLLPGDRVQPRPLRAELRPAPRT